MSRQHHSVWLAWSPLLRRGLFGWVCGACVLWLALACGGAWLAFACGAAWLALAWLAWLHFRVQGWGFACVASVQGRGFGVGQGLWSLPCGYVSGLPPVFRCPELVASSLPFFVATSLDARNNKCS